MNIIDEDINYHVFLSRLKQKFTECDNIKQPKDCGPMIQLVMSGDTLVGIKINTFCIILGERWSDDAYYKLTATEFISTNAYEKRNCHNKFSFDFRGIEEEIELSKFRFDYAPDKLTPLHAHDNDYIEEKNKNHLKYPEDIQLNLNKIDLNTTIKILENYITKPNEYPLDNKLQEKYNKIVINERKNYDNRC